MCRPAAICPPTIHAVPVASLRAIHPEGVQHPPAPRCSTSTLPSACAAHRLWCCPTSPHPASVVGLSVMATGEQGAAGALPHASPSQEPKPQEPEQQQDRQQQAQNQQQAQQQQRQQQQQPPPQAHGRMYDVSYKAINRALMVEQEALQKIHVRIQKQLQHLEAEEKIIEHMIKRQEPKPNEELQEHL